MGFFCFIKKFFLVKLKLKTYLCRKHRHDLLLRSSTKYIKFFQDKSIYLKISYGMLDDEVNRVFVKELRNSLSNDEIKILNKEKCICDNQILKNKIKTIEEQSIKIIIENDINLMKD